MVGYEEARRRAIGEAGWSLAVPAAVVVLAAGGAVAASEGFGLQGWAMLAAYSIAAALVVVADLRTLRAPNRVVYPAIVAALGIATFSGLDDFLAASAGGMLAFVLLLVAVAVSRGAMGMGDAKFGALCGIVTGLQGVAFMLAASFIAGGVYAVAMLSLGRRQRRDVVAFTPFLVLGTLVAVGAGRSFLGS